MSLNVGITQQETRITRLSGLAAEARLYSENMAMNMFHLGRVFTEAKTLVPHGQWGAWLRDNSGMSERSAQQLMQVYARFGDQPQLAGLEKSKLFKMLSLPSGMEEVFIEDNDLENMTARQVEAAVQEVKARMQAEINEERQIRQDVAARATELENRLRKSEKGGLPDEVVETLKKQEETIKRQKAMLEAAQETINESGRRLVEQQRKNDREEAHPEEESLDAELRMAVGAFLSSPAGIAAEDSRRVMSLNAIQRQDALSMVGMLEGWCRKMREKLNEFSGEVTIV